MILMKRLISLALVILTVCAEGRQFVPSVRSLSQLPQVYIHLEDHWLLFARPVGPFLLKDTVYGSLEPMAELLQAKVTRDGNLLRVMRGETTVEVKVGSTRALINGSSVNLSAPPFLMLSSDTILMPVAILLRAFGFSYEFRTTNGINELAVKNPATIEAYIRSSVYWWDTGPMVDGLAASEVTNLLPTRVKFDLVQHPISSYGLVAANLVVVLKEVAGVGLGKSSWGIYTPDPNNAPLMGWVPTPFSDGSTPQPPCPVSGTQVKPYQTVDCKLKFLPGDMLFIRIINY